MRRDTMLHLIVSTGLVVGFQIAGAPRWKAALYTVAVGATREAIQKQGAEGWHDMKANGVGTALGVVLTWRWH